MARAQVDHGGEEEPSLAGAQVGDVAHELAGGDGAREVAAHQVGAGLGVRVGDRGPLPGVRRAAAYAQLAHQLEHPVSREAAETRRQHRVHEAEAEPAVGLEPHAHHRVALGGPPVPRAAAREPRVEARPAHAENAGHQGDGEFGLLLQHEAVARGYPCSLAKKAAAFFRNAFSISSSRMRLRASRRRLATHLSTVFGFSPSSLQHSAVGLPVEMM